MNDGIVGFAAWKACETCRFNRADIGGCIPLDDDTATFQVDDADNVICEAYEAVPDEQK